ncbi:MAG TPA: protein kinase [Gemmatimonadales bacterium]|nr:protein kinase [Gemmatimonadales bacterium]
MTDTIDRLKAALADRYRIERELGQGGMATVYLAEDLKHDRKVAVKVLRPELAAVLGAERFVQEIKTTAALQHPHILPLFDSGTADGFLYYVMPYIEGETLRQKLDRETQLGIDEAVTITTEVADALDYAHRHGVIHRDIKHENILLHDGRAMVADFGIALAVSAAAGGRMTETGLSLGTPHYMSPEQATAEKEITARSDVYSLGSVLYEMLTGEPPHTGSSAQQIIMKIVTEEAEPVTKARKSAPPNVAAAVAKSLEKLPADRFATASELAKALKDSHYTHGVMTTLASSGARGPASPATRWVMGVSVIGLALLAAWGWTRAWRSENIPNAWQHITFGANLEPFPGVPSLALSPDGTILAFRENQPNGLLWLKHRDRLDPVPISGTERALSPEFSPDGDWIAFIADGRLKKVRVAGGAAVTLSDSVDGSGYGGAAWLDDGTLVYTNRGVSELHRVSATGGTRTLALRDTALVGGGIGHPVALPGARGVLFQYCSSGCVNMSIHVFDLKAGTQRRLLDDVAQAWYLPDGRLLYVRRDGVAVVARFDLDRLEMTGEAVPVLEGVAVQSQTGFAPLAWSSSGAMVYIRGSGPSNEDLVVRVDRHGVIAPLDTNWSGSFNGLSLSPDGRRLAVGGGSGTAINIWIKDLDGGPFTRLTFGNQDRRPAWSPDGGLVAFIRDSSTTGAVYGRRADGSGGDTLLARLDRQVQEAAWSPDGAWLVLRTDNATAGAGDLIGIPMDGARAPVPLVATRFTELHPTISPDGKWLAYSSNESGVNEVYVRPFPATETARWQVSNGGGNQPVWSASGEELFYLDPNLTLMVVRVRGGTTFQAGTPQPLFSVQGMQIDGFHQSFVTMPDDSGFLFLRSQALAKAGSRPEVVWLDDWAEAFETRVAN